MSEVGYMAHRQKMLHTLLTGGARLPRGASINFQEVVSPYALCNLESFSKKFTNQYISFQNLFNVRGA